MTTRAPTTPTSSASATAGSSVAAPVGRILLRVGDWVTGWLERVPYSALAIPLRLAVADVFWRSAMAHLANMQTTLYLFENQYHVPLLPPDFAAYLTVSIEVIAPVLLVAGLLTRFTSLVLIGMVLVIEIFVFPQAWPTHIQWFAMLLVLLCRGPGTLSIDHWLRRWLLQR